MLSDYIETYLDTPENSPLFADEQVTLTAVQAKARVREIATLIDKEASKQQKCIAVYLPRTTDFLATIFASWYTGNYYVPLNQSWPSAFLRKILEKAKPDVIVTNKNAESLAEINTGNAAIVVLPTTAATATATPSIPDIWHSKRQQRDGLAYLIFTSGSTGDQKGVLIEKSAFTSYIDYINEEFKAYKENTSLLISGEMTFDITLADISFALANQTAMYLSSDPRNIIMLANMLVKNKIDTFYGVPTTHRYLFQFLKARKLAGKTSLKTIFTGGDVFTHNLLSLIHSVAPRASVYNMYGPTEATMNILGARMDTLDAKEYPQLPTGRAFPHLDLQLWRDSAFANDEGELVVAGSQCMRGYLNDPQRTESAFLERDKKKYYRTGDWFTCKNGYYTFSHRIDTLCKIQGYRINLIDVSRALETLPFVSAASTVFIDVKEQKLLVSFIEPMQQTTIPEDKEIIAMLAQDLPTYMVPAKISVLERLPLGSTGKVDQKHLKELALHKFGAELTKRFE